MQTPFRSKEYSIQGVSWVREQDKAHNRGIWPYFVAISLRSIPIGGSVDMPGLEQVRDRQLVVKLNDLLSR